MERNLDSKGKDEIRIVSENLLKMEVNPSLIISSHAARAFQSAEIVAKKLGYNVKNIEIEKEIYYTETESLFEVIEKQNDKYQSIVLAGHNPTITDFANQLSRDFRDSIPTGGLVAFDLHTNAWGSFRDHDIKYLFHIYPDQPSVDSR